MTDPIEEMKKAGWKLVSHADNCSLSSGAHKQIVFIKENPKPNAIIDWDRLRDIRSSADRAYLLSEGQSTVESLLLDVREFLNFQIKKAE